MNFFIYYKLTDAPLLRPQIESNVIVFVTAYDQYALDVICKDANSLKKFLILYLQHLLEVVASKTITNKRKSYLVYHQDKLIPLSVDDISWFYSISNKKYIIDDKA